MKPQATSTRQPTESERQTLEWVIAAKQPLLTVPQVARFLSTSDVHILNLIEDGQLVAFQIGVSRTPKRRHFRIQRFSVVALMLNRLEDRGIELSVQLPGIDLVNAWRADLRHRGAKSADTPQICPRTRPDSARPIMRPAAVDKNETGFRQVARASGAVPPKTTDCRP